MPRGIKIAAAGGGTGGHLFPALAILEEVEDRTEARIEYFGTSRGTEARIVPGKGYKFHKIWIKGYPRRIKPELLILPIKFIVSVVQSLWHLLKFWPDCVLATGGYTCLPLMLAGRLFGLPIVIHEQNSLPGVTSKIGALWAKTVFYSFENSIKYFAKNKDARLSGNPVRKELIIENRHQAFSEFNLNPERKTILVFGGSQGAATLNNAVAESVQEISEKYNLIWQTGKGNLPDKVPSNVTALEFIDDMGKAYSAADMTFCRSGAMTLTEIAAVGLPAVLVPFPYAAEDHQRLNAEPLAEAGAAQLVLDKDFNGRILLEKADELLNDEIRLKDIAEKIRKFHKPDAGRIIADRIIEIAGERSAR